MDYVKTGQFIAERRKQLNLTQKQLGEKLNVTDKAVSKWERGLGYPDVSILGELSEILGVGIGEILNGEYNDSLKDNSLFVKKAVDYSKKITEDNIYNKIKNALYVILILIVLNISYMGIKQFIYLNNEVETEISEKLIEEYNKTKEKIDIIKINGYLNDVKDSDNYIQLLEHFILFFDDYEIFSTNKKKYSEFSYMANAFNWLYVGCNTANYFLSQLDPDNMKYYYPICINDHINIENDIILGNDYIYYELLYYYDRMNEFDKLDFYYKAFELRLYKINALLDFIIEVGEKND